MTYEAAPMEGITDYLWRRVHARCFPGTDRYYTPFFSVTPGFSLRGRAAKELQPPPEGVRPLVPQLLTRSGEDFLAAARLLADRGFPEINLNLGCPSGTVTAKGKGSGLLRDRPALESLLDAVFSRCPVPVSLKTRAGWQSPAEWPDLLHLYNGYPAARLILHARTRGEMYGGRAHRELYALTLRESRAPVCISGDLNAPADCAGLAAEFPELDGVMLGRGLAADPGLIARCQGRQSGGVEALRAFDGELYETYKAAFRDPRSAMMRMKELWSYQITRFRDSDELAARLARARTPSEFEGLTDTVFRTLEWRED